MRRRAASLLPSDDFLRRSFRVHPPGSYRKSRSLSPPRAQWPAHPLTPLLLFLFLFPFSRLVVKLSAHCAAGELAACAHNNPVPERTGVTGNSTAPFAPNWRDDGRCGPGWQARGGVIASCDPFSMHYCCSQWGWCGKGPEYCMQGPRRPFNETASEGPLRAIWTDVRHRLDGFVDSWTRTLGTAARPVHEAHAPILAAAHSRRHATDGERPLLSAAGALAVRQLERFACCQGGVQWQLGQDDRWHLLLPDQTVKRAPEEAPPAPPTGLLSSLWRWLTGGRSLKAVAEPVPLLESAWGPPGMAGSLDPARTTSQDALQLPSSASVGHAVPDCGVGGQKEPGAAQPVPCSDTDSSKGAGEQGGSQQRRLLQLPRLWRKDAFRLSDQEAESLTQRLGIGTASSPAPGTSQDEPAGQSTSTHSSSRPTPVNQQPERPQIASGLTRERADKAGSKSEAADVEDDAELDSRTAADGSRSRCLGQLDPVCYNETTRCNQQRWLHLHGAADSSARQDSLVSVVSKEGLGTFKGQLQGSADTQAEVLVLYHYFENPGTCMEDEEVQLMRTNLLYFLRVAVRPNDGAHYVINMGGRLDPRLIALVPDFCNVRVRFVDNSTLHSDTCTFQRTLSEIGPALLVQYKYTVVINNGMRGPFVAGTQERHWTQPLTSLLSDMVKAVGPYISCEVSTHVQGPLMALDRVGVQYLLATWGGCWDDHGADILHGEVGLSRRLLADGYNIASLQPEYAGLDFRQHSTALRCKGRGNPAFCCGVPDPLALHWVKYGGEVYRLGLLPASMLRIVEELTERTLSLTPPLQPNERWQVPSDMWAREQMTASRRRRKLRGSDRQPWWRRSGWHLLEGRSEEGADGLYAAQQAREILNAASNATRQAATKDFQCDSRGSSLRHLGIDAETGAFSASSGKHTVPGHKLNPQNINSDREADWHSETALQTINKLQKLQKFIV